MVLYEEQFPCKVKKYKLPQLLNTLFARLEKISGFSHLKDAVFANKVISVAGLAGSLQSIIAANFVRQNKSKIIYIAQDPLNAEFARDDFTAVIGSENVAYFCEKSDIPKEYRLQNVMQTNARLSSLELLLSEKAAVITTTPMSAQDKVMSKKEMQEQAVLLNTDTTIEFSQFIHRLTEMGFVRETIVDRVGEFSVRGGIIDIYPYSRQKPIRVEFFGNTIETLREFDPQTQRSTGSLNEIMVYPQHFDQEPKLASSTDKCEPQPLQSILSYLTDQDIVIFQNPFRILQYVNSKSEERLDRDNLFSDESKNGQSLSHRRQCEELFHSESNVRKVFFFEEADSAADFNFHIDPIIPMAGNFESLQEKIDAISLRANLHSKFKPQLFFLCGNDTQKKRIIDLLKEEEINTDTLDVEICSLNKGFLFWEAGIFVFTDHEFFSRSRIPQAVSQPQEGFTFRQLRALRRGDFVVHVEYGIGIYRGLKKISVDGSDQECVQIEYRDGDKVYVTLERLDRIKKYSSREGVVPQINKLGSVDWQKLKSRTKKRLKDISEKLIILYAKRQQVEGFAFDEDDLWQHELEASFVYTETPDQLQTTADVKRDMENVQPMDRLICGDVGYGKTEVAIRASFKAVNNGKQVAILVPTTILANQHYKTFVDRLASFPVKVEMLSRFRSKREQEEIVNELKNGKVDIIIGTHRLLSKDISFKDLGLLIIDEEQRFGVSHKEKIKSLRANIDALTLTATPIPRTLHMALTGIREMSRINTAPSDRLPIRTEVIQFNESIIRQAIHRELHRGGQVFFVHNRVQSINGIAAMLSRFCPEARFAVAHGQMRERELEKVMSEFVQKKYDCLVSTMIIESGLDIPNVNTLIVNRADKFGLAQLYQLRGRVGRSSQQAFAYLVVPTIRRLTREAIKRLQAIEELTELGSGFQLALRDLEVRGAGNLLGAEQSGFMDALGSDLFYKILDEAVSEVRYEKGLTEAPHSDMQSVETKVIFKGDAFLPESFVSMGSERVDIYRRLVDSKTVEEVQAIEDELEDRFGRLPTAAKKLLDYVSIKILGNLNQISDVKISSDVLNVQFDFSLLNDKSKLQKRIGTIVHKASLPFEFSQQEGLKLQATFKGEEKPLSQTKKFLQSIM